MWRTALLGDHEDSAGHGGCDRVTAACILSADWWNWVTWVYHSLRLHLALSGPVEAVAGIVAGALRALILDC